MEDSVLSVLHRLCSQIRRVRHTCVASGRSQEREGEM